MPAEVRRPPLFCNNCGASLWDDLGAKYFVAAGLMRELEMKPGFHMMVANKAHWDTIGDDAPQYDGAPPA